MSYSNIFDNGNDIIGKRIVQLDARSNIRLHTLNLIKIDVRLIITIFFLHPSFGFEDDVVYFYINSYFIASNATMQSL